jgi:hypothetical protein
MVAILSILIDLYRIHPYPTLTIANTHIQAHIHSSTDQSSWHSPEVSVSKAKKVRTTRREASPIGSRGWSKAARGQQSSKYTHTHTHIPADRPCGYGEGRRVVHGRAEVRFKQRRAWIIHWELSERENPTENVPVRRLHTI